MWFGNMLTSTGGDIENFSLRIQGDYNKDTRTLSKNSNPKYIITSFSPIITKRNKFTNIQIFMRHNLRVTRTHIYRERANIVGQYQDHNFHGSHLLIQLGLGFEVICVTTFNTCTKQYLVSYQHQKKPPTLPPPQPLRAITNCKH